MANNPIVNMFRVKEIRSRIFFTLIVLAVFRLGSVLTIPGINPAIAGMIASVQHLVKVEEMN